jgi:hypothetical protein
VFKAQAQAMSKNTGTSGNRHKREQAQARTGGNKLQSQAITGAGASEY